MRKNYIEITNALAEQLAKGSSLLSVVGFLDDPKIRSSLRHFERIARQSGDQQLQDSCLRAMQLCREEPEPAQLQNLQADTSAGAKSGGVMILPDMKIPRKAAAAEDSSASDDYSPAAKPCSVSIDSADSSPVAAYSTQNKRITDFRQFYPNGESS